MVNYYYYLNKSVFTRKHEAKIIPMMKTIPIQNNLLSGDERNFYKLNN